MQFCPADWPFLPNAFEYMKSVWPFTKISDWPFLRNTVELLSTLLFAFVKISDISVNFNPNQKIISKEHV